MDSKRSVIDKSNSAQAGTTTLHKVEEASTMDRYRCRTPGPPSWASIHKRAPYVTPRASPPITAKIKSNSHAGAASAPAATRVSAKAETPQTLGFQRRRPRLAHQRIGQNVPRRCAQLLNDNEGEHPHHVSMSVCIGAHQPGEKGVQCDEHPGGTPQNGVLLRASQPAAGCDNFPRAVHRRAARS